MTHQTDPTTPSISVLGDPAANHRISRRLGAGASLLMMLVLLSPMLIAGCKKKTSLSGGRSNTQSSTPTAQQHTRPVRLTPDELNLAAKVQFPANMVPDDEQAARAVASFASALSTGDSDALASLLDRSDAAVLDRLVASGGWDAGSDAIKVVRVCMVDEDAGSLRLGLGIEDDRGAYLLGWSAALQRDGWKFSALPIESPIASKASDLDGVELINTNIPEPGPVVAETVPTKAPVDTKKKRSGSRRPARRKSLGPG